MREVGGIISIRVRERVKRGMMCRVNASVYERVWRRVDDQLESRVRGLIVWRVCNPVRDQAYDQTIGEG